MNSLPLFIALLLTFNIHCYEGEDEVNDFFSKISDLRNPSLEEYREIQNFLMLGKRPYLSPYYLSPHWNEKDTTIKRRTGRTLKLVGDNGEMPIFEIHHLGNSQHSERCILLYSSYNTPYPNKVRRLLEELKNKGFEGDVLFRIGGFPYMQKEGIKLCHVPYAWKIAFFYEALELGYKKILWLDTSMHPLKNLNEVFALIDKHDYLMFSPGFYLDYPFNLKEHLPEPIASLGVPLTLLDQIPHIGGAVIGFNVEKAKSIKILKEWMEETKKVNPCINWYPEELCLSVIAWKNQCEITISGEKLFTSLGNSHLREADFPWNFAIDYER